MNRKLIIYGAILLLLVGLVIFIEAVRPKPVNWSPTYATKDKIPFGLYVLDKELPTLFKGQKIERFSKTPYEFFEPLYDYDKETYTAKGTFINIDETSRLDKESVKELLYFAEHGNTVFLSMKDFPPTLLDTLKTKVSSGFYYKDSITLSVQNNPSKKQTFAEGISFSHFDSIDKANTVILGHQEVDTLKQVNFIKVPFGKGRFLLHTQPEVFTNFHLLKNNHYEYAQGVLSYIAQGKVYWHNKQFQGSGISGSPLRYIIKNPPLKWAMYIGLTGLLIFILFNAKRKQRVIPEITPLKNTTVDFTKTIGNLYYMEGNHHTIIEKKIIYFLEKIRNEYMIDTYSLDEEFIEKLHLKTGSTVQDIQQTVSLIKKHRHQFQSTEADVIEINKAIEKIRL